MKALLLISAVVFLIAASLLNRATNIETEKERKWLEFSMNHHCRVAQPPSFRDETTTWQCDGFQVVR